MIRFTSWLLASILAVGCMEKPDMEAEDGKPASYEDVFLAVKWGWDNNQVDTQSLEVKESTNIVRSAQLLGQTPQDYELQRLDVIGYEDDPLGHVRTFKVVAQTKNMSDGNEKPIPAKQWDYDFVLTPNIFQLGPQSIRTKEESQPPLSVHYTRFFADICRPDPQTGWNPKCYNLSTREAKEPVPKAVMNRPGCEGVPNCMMNVRYVTFDLVTEHFDEQKGATTRLKQLNQLKFSTDVPFMSRLLSLCYQGIGTFKGQPYVATICSDVIDFERGDGTP